MSLDDEILSEERLDESQELMLYNMSLRQTSQRAAGGREGTHVLLSKFEGNPMYQEMIERGLLDCKIYGQGVDDSAAATLLVTQKGLRYCVLFADEIEPRRAFDVAGVQRERMADGGQVPSPGGVNYSDLIWGAAEGGSAAKNAAFALTSEQVANFERLGAQRRSSQRRHAREFGFGSTLEKVEFVSESGDVWYHAPLDGEITQVVGVTSSSVTLEVPSEIDGMPVVAIAADALSENEVVEEIVCPDSVEAIGTRAFRLNPKLKRLVLPPRVAEFQSNWIARCPSLEEIVLPGLAEEITRGVFESGRLRKLVIGEGMRSIQPGAFQDTCLESVEISAANPFMTTDGAAIYTKDGSELLALARPVESLAIAQGCKKLAKKSCCGFAQLRDVEFPDSLAEIGPFAFSRTGIECFAAPSSLRVIDEKAFYGCASLKGATLNDGLEIIGDSAFEGSAIPALEIPASIKWLGKSMTKGTGVVHSGPGCTLTIAEGCEDLLLDGAGGLYRKQEDGFHLVQLVDGELERYSVLDGAVAIDEHAFAYHDNILIVRVAQSVRSIGRSAFRVCKNLQRVVLPDSIESIGEEAFFDTNLEEFRVPAALTELGERALVTFGAHHGNKMPSLAQIEVAPGNDVFYVACGMLCRREGASSSVVVFTSSEPRVVFPAEVTRIEDYAFGNARGIEYLELNPRLSTIGTNGLSTRCWIRHIRVELADLLAGRKAFDFFFPDTPGAVRGIALGLGGASWVNVPGIMEQLDLCLVNARDYNVPGKSGNISAYAQAKLLLDRLDDPVMLTPRNRSMMERVLRNNIEDICVDVALYDDRTVLGDLIDRGFVNAGNLEGVIERVGALRDAATSAFLLETKRERFSGSMFDYDL
ncbi:MAG TPA: hypothetical protein DCP91_04340 [Eggerthellaceae bacterium]|nr:hypothetical protein [Eggerthellaceae bacterium]